MAKPTKPAPTPMQPKSAQPAAVASDPAAVMQFNIPANQVPEPIRAGPNVNDLNRHDTHVGVYCAPNQKFNKAAVDMRCKAFVGMAMVRYRKHKVAGPVNSIIFKKELRDVLADHGIVNVDLDKVISDGGGIPKL